MDPNVKETRHHLLQNKIRELTRTHDDMANLLASTGIAALFLDRNLNIRRTTPAADRLLSTRPSDQGRSLARFAPPFARVNIHEVARKVLTQQETIEREILANSGRWYTLRVMPYRTGVGIIDGVVLTLIDINRLKRTQHDLTDREDRLRLALEGGRMGAWEFDPETGHIQWDQRTADIFDQTPDRLPRTAEAFYDLLHPEDVPVVKEAIDRALAETGSFHTEFRIRNAAGTERWVAGRGRIFYESGGRPKRMLGVSYDITERKSTRQALQENEHRFRLAIQAMQGMVYEWNLKTGHVWRSDGLHRLLGRGPDEVSGDAAGWDRLIHPDDLGYVKETIRNAREDNETRYELVYRIRHGSGHYVYIHDHGIIERDGRGRPGRVVGSAYDITGRKTAEDELKRLNEELEERVQLRTQALHQSREKIRQLAHLASTAEERERRRIAEGLHDNVQQLLAACTFSLQGLTNGAENAVIQERVGNIVQWSQEALNATRSLIFDLSPAVLYEIGLDAAVSHLASQVEERYGLTLELERDETLDPLPEEIRVFIYSIIRELILNVAKHAEVDRARVGIARKQKAIRVEVTDHGRGFLPAEIEQLKQSNEDHRGLGLMSLRERLTTIGGTLQLVSAPGEGTNIRIFVPVQD